MRLQKRAVMAFVLVIIIGLLIYSAIHSRNFLWPSLALAAVSFFYLLLRFEKRAVEPRELVLLAVLASIAAVGRIPFASIPGVQPTSFVIIISGYIFGAESGLLIGTVAALASNMILGQGPWTPWQMAAWGLIGFTAGLLRRTAFMNRGWGRLLFGLVWGFVFGGIMNLWGYLAFVQSGGEVGFASFTAYFAASSLFDSLHAASNVFFLVLFGNAWIRHLSRFKVKYGLLEDKK